MANKEITGKLLKEMAQRDEIVVATKAFGVWRNAPNCGGLSRKALFAAIDDSLTRLGMDHVDLFQIHRWDDNTPIEETMEALHDIVKAGKALYIGASSMHAWQFMKALGVQRANGFAQFVSKAIVSCARRYACCTTNDLDWPAIVRICQDIVWFGG